MKGRLSLRPDHGSAEGRRTNGFILRILHKLSIPSGPGDSLLAMDMGFLPDERRLSFPTYSEYLEFIKEEAA